MVFEEHRVLCSHWRLIHDPTSTGVWPRNIFSCLRVVSSLFRAKQQDDIIGLIAKMEATIEQARTKVRDNNEMLAA